MTLEDQIRLHKALTLQIEQLEVQRKQLGLSILQAMPNNSLQFGNFYIRRCSRLSIKLSLEEARALQATKLEETVDKDKIKTLHRSGQSIKGVYETEYISITSQKSFATNE